MQDGCKKLLFMNISRYYLSFLDKFILPSRTGPNLCLILKMEFFADTLKIACQHFIRTWVKKGPKMYVTSRIHCIVKRKVLCFIQASFLKKVRKKRRKVPILDGV